MDDLLGEFLVETGEQLEELDACLVRFEADPNDAEVLKTIFRVAHTIKGTCGFFDLPRLARLAHAVEALMSQYRDGAPVAPAGVTAILVSLDRFKQILAQLERDGTEPQGNDDDLIQALEALADEDVVPQEPEASAAEVPASPVHSHLDALEQAWHQPVAAAVVADSAQALDRPEAAIENT
jgi:two-component system, chemotaxis family, sensor kinase CheA